MAVIFKKPVDKIGRRWQPKEHDVIVAIELLKQHIPMDEPFSLHWGESQKGVIRLRIKSWTNDRPWRVDIYKNNYFHIQVGTDPSEGARGVSDMLVILARHLRIKLSI